MEMGSGSRAVRGFLATLIWLPGVRPSPSPVVVDMRPTTRVLLVTVDDVGREILAAAPTPNLDRLSLSGVSFERFWAAPTCSIFRARVMSGGYSHRPSNWVGKALFPKDGDAWSLPVGASLPLLLNGASSLVGKWHLGHVSNQATHPHDAGFHYWWGTNFNLPKQTGSYYGGSCWDDGQPSSWSGYLTEVEGARAIERIDRGDVFVALSFHGIHAPREAPPDHLHSYGDLTGADDRILSVAMLEAVDHVLGRVTTHALERGFTVLATSDNGTSGAVGGGKRTLFEVGVRTWMYAVGPGVRVGSSFELVEATDLYATISELVNGTPAYTTDSISFVPQLYTPISSPREFLFTAMFEPNGRLPDPALWERGLRDRRWKVHLAGPDLVGLYDLDADPEEDDNLADGDLTDEERAAVVRLLSMHP